MNRRTILYIILTLLFIIGIGGLFSIKSEGRKDYFGDTNIAYEQEYIKELKNILGEYRMSNAGITMTKTSEDGSFTEYTVKIHTGKENTREMRDRIDTLGIIAPDSSVSVVFD